MYALLPPRLRQRNLCAGRECCQRKIGAAAGAFGDGRVAAAASVACPGDAAADGELGCVLLVEDDVTVGVRLVLVYCMAMDARTK